MANLSYTRNTVIIPLYANEPLGVQAKKINNALVGQVPELALYSEQYNSSSKTWTTYRWKNTPLLITLGNHDEDSWYGFSLRRINADGTIPDLTSSSAWFHISDCLGSSNSTVYITVIRVSDFFLKIIIGKKELSSTVAFTICTGTFPATKTNALLIASYKDAPGLVNYTNPTILSDDSVYYGQVSEVYEPNVNNLAANAGYGFALIPRLQAVYLNTEMFFGPFKFGGIYTVYRLYQTTPYQLFQSTPGATYSIMGSTITAIDESIYQFLQ